MIRPYHIADKEDVVTMIASLRVFLAKLKSIDRTLDLESAAAELESYLRNNFPVFVAEVSDGLAGYLVCKIDEDVVWAESIFVRPEYRRQGIASSLYVEAERLTQELGGDTVYNWVHPNNNVSISFLKKRGYNVLNLIELRRPWKGEELSTKVRVEENMFDY
ncbi:MAG: GNAT family N-acetyltransferase [Candidatus Thorarchaeota archaeon]|nr:MAG: GNAT family N-acetyltransferase [Candidatus Thorarchaeota archaeon]